MSEMEHNHGNEEYDEPTLQGLLIQDVRYADNTALIATTSKGLHTLIQSANNHSGQNCLLLRSHFYELRSHLLPSGLAQVIGLAFRYRCAVGYHPMCDCARWRINAIKESPIHKMSHQGVSGMER